LENFPDKNMIEAGWGVTDHPNATPAEVRTAIIESATIGQLNMSAGPVPLPGTPNRLLYSNFV
jgi:hypothetical protein